MMRRSLGSLVWIALVSLAGAADPPSAGRPLSAAEEKWLKEVKDFLKTPAEKKEFEEEFRADTHAGRKGIYDFFRKTLAAKAKAKSKRGLEKDLGEENAIEMVPLPGGRKTGDGVQRKPLTGPHAGKMARPLSREEARWLKEIIEAERDDEEKLDLLREFKAEGPVGRKAMYEWHLKRKNAEKRPRE